MDKIKIDIQGVDYAIVGNIKVYYSTSHGAWVISENKNFTSEIIDIVRKPTNLTDMIQYAVELQS